MTPPKETREPRLAAVLTHPTQYYAPWFRHIAAHGGLALRVFYLSDAGRRAAPDRQFGREIAWDVDLTGGYEHEWVPNRAGRPATDRFLGVRNPELAARLSAFGPDALLLFGYTYASHLRALAWARRRRVPVLFRGDSHFLGRRPPAGPRGWLMRFIFRRFAVCLPVGAANRRYFRTLGVPDDRLVFAPHAVDAGRFDPADPVSAREAGELRASLGLGEGCAVVLFAGKFVPAKGPRLLLAAFRRLAPPGAALVFVGDGVERPGLETDAAAARNAGLQVRVLPFANQSAMPSRYRLASIFALPSTGLYETWGLAVNEAMHLGVPCLVSDRVGCHEDLVTDGVTGWVAKAGDEDDLTAALDRALADVRRRPAELRAAVRERISGYSFTRATAGLRDAVHLALSPSS
jgi:glycosyltransferase involved in cell wall biosynthesis